MSRRPISWIAVLAALVLTLGMGNTALADSGFPMNVSGLEISPLSSLTIVKNPDGSADVYGTTFQGWTGGNGATSTGWVASPGAGGSLTLAVNYHAPSGRVGIGHSVILLSGTAWSLTLPDGDQSGGSVVGGTVQWPGSLAGDLGCGAGVAVVSGSLTFTSDDGSGETGAFQGCLDDTHLTTVFPPHIWGTITQGE